MKPLLKTILLFLLTALLLLAVPALAESNIAVLFDAASGTYDPDYSQYIASVGDTLYIARTGGLYAYHIGEESPKQLMDFTKTDLAGEPLRNPENGTPPVYALISSGDALFAMDFSMGCLWRFDESNAAFEREASFDPEEAFGIGGDSRYQFSSYILDDSNMYYISKNVMDSSTRLMRLDLKNGLSELVCMDITMASPYAPGVLLVNTGAQGAPGTLSLLNSNTGLVEKKLSLATVYSSMNYDPGTGTVYLVRKGEIDASTCFAEPVPAARMPIRKALFGGALLPGGYLALPYEDGVRLYLTGPDAVKALPLKIAGNNAANLPMEAFSDLHPEITFSLSDPYLRSTLELVTHMKSGDSAADIYCISLMNYSLDVLYEKGYYAGLEDSDAVQSTVGAMYPFLKDALMRDGKIIALPFSKQSNMYVYNPKAFEEVGLTKKDVPKTYSELLEFITRWGDEFAEQYPSMSLFSPEMEERIFREHILRTILEDRLYACMRKGEPVTYDTDEIKALLNKLKDTDFSVINAIMPDPPMDDDFWKKQMFQIGPEASTQSYTVMYTNYMPLQLSDQEPPVILTNIEVLIINPYSQNYDTALKFVDYMAGSLPATLRADLMPGENQPVYLKEAEEGLKWFEENIPKDKKALEEAKAEDKRFYQDRLDALLAEYENAKRFAWESTGESIATYRALDPYFMLKKPNPIYGLGSSLELQNMIYNRFLDGQISADQLVKELDKRMRMMALENKE